MGNKQQYEDIEITRERDIIRKIEMFYKGERKRCKNDAEVEVNSKGRNKKKKLDYDVGALMAHNSQFSPAISAIDESIQEKQDYDDGVSTNEIHISQFSPANSNLEVNFDTKCDSGIVSEPVKSGLNRVFFGPKMIKIVKKCVAKRCL